MTGARPGNTPSSPSNIGTTMNSPTPSNTAFSGVTTTSRTCPLRWSSYSVASLGMSVCSTALCTVGSVTGELAILFLCLAATRSPRSGALRSADSASRLNDRLLPGLHPLVLLGGLLDAADVHERGLGQVVPLAVAQLLEAADRV